MSKDACFMRQGMIDELDTVNKYRKMMLECESPECKKVFASIIEEEMVHVGEFQFMLEHLCSMSEDKINEGKEEARSLIIESPFN